VLTPESYQVAWLVYGAASLAALLYLFFVLASRFNAATRIALILLLAGLVLTPAHPGEDIKTWAPAIFVTGFELMTSGVEAAARPLRSLVAAEALALALCVLLWLARLLLRLMRGSRSGS
jgi:hypothetical protein